jgi:hypothetical protein
MPVLPVAYVGHAVRILIVSCFGGATMRSLRFAIIKPLNHAVASTTPQAGMEPEDTAAGPMCRANDAMPSLNYSDRDLSGVVDGQQDHLVSEANLLAQLLDAFHQAALSSCSIHRGAEPSWWAGVAAAVVVLSVCWWTFHFLLGYRFRLTVRDGRAPCQIELRLHDGRLREDVDLHCSGLSFWSRRRPRAVTMAEEHLSSLMRIPSWSSTVLVVNV